MAVVQSKSIMVKVFESSRQESIKYPSVCLILPVMQSGRIAHPYLKGWPQGPLRAAPKKSKTANANSRTPFLDVGTGLKLLNKIWISPDI